MKPQFSVSLMCLDFLRIKEQLEALNHKADYYHIDIMDGHFCKNITLSPDMIRACKRVSTLPMDVHLMTTTPTDWLDVVAEAGADFISVHAETVNTDAFRTLRHIENLGCKKGMVLNPATTLATIEHYAELLDMLTIMTVDVGYAGQRFIEQMLPKIELASTWKERHGYSYSIQIDGGCNQATFKRLVNAGADVLVVGTSGLFGLDDDVNIAYDKMLAEYCAAMA